jgi:hypothetical protein
MRRHLKAALFLAMGLVFATGGALAEGFGTPVVDGVLDSVYGSAEAMDPSDDPQGNAVMDLLDLYVCNDTNFWYFYFTIDADIVGTNWGKYVIYIDTTNDANGATYDAWGRNVVVQDPHKPEFGIYTWVDVAPYDPSDTQIWAWNGTSWDLVGSVTEAALQGGTVSAIEWKVPKSVLGNPSTIWCEVWCTGGGGGDNAQDTSNDPPDDWNATDWFTQAVLLNSTEVAEVSGGDTTPPTVVEAKALGQEPITQIQVTFSEPVDQTTAENAANYTVSGGITVNQATLQGDQLNVVLDVTPALDYGICYQVTVVNVEDLAGNPIVDDGVGNVACFKVFDLLWRANMNIHLREHTYYPEPDTVALEGSMDPLTWLPTCDVLLSDDDGDSVYTGRFQFNLSCDCQTGLIEPVSLEYKFTHQCDEWESIGNHVYTFSDTVGRDTLDIWWNDQAPVDFTSQAVKVIWFVQTSHLENPPQEGVDTLGINGSQPPLTWDIPPINLLHDDGVLPDSIAGDGIWSIEVTFPAGTYKYVYYKFVLNNVYECEGQGNRDVYLNDEIYSETNPLIMPLLYYDLCNPASVGSPEGAADLRFTLGPNPMAPGGTISFYLPEASRVKLRLYDVRGRMLRVLSDGVLQAGIHNLVFDGRDAGGRVLPAGSYFLKLEAGQRTATTRVTVLR